MYSLYAVGVYFYPSSIQVIRRMLEEQKGQMDLDFILIFLFFFYESGLYEVKYSLPVFQ